jgi:magnesium chelatase subunit D
VTASPEWLRAMRALAALVVDPVGLKGIVLRVRAGPVRAALDREIAALPGPVRRIHAGLADEALFGGLDLAASLAEGREVRSEGLVRRPALVVLPMAERTPPALAARLAQLLDAGFGHRLCLLDESAGDDEGVPACLAERLGFHADLNAVRHVETGAPVAPPGALAAARDRLPAVTLPDEASATMAALAAAFGIHSLRAPLLALRAARALAALNGVTAASEIHLREAAELVFPHRATQVPHPQDDPPAPDPSPEPSDADEGGEPSALPDELLVTAVRACLSPDLLARLASDSRAARQAAGSGAGDRRRSNRRGRPLSARPGTLDGRARIDLVATLRAAAPWQALRRAARPDATGLLIRPADIRLSRFEDRSDRLLVFLVDASGSTAMTRLAEAKGAVELLLGQAYARRDQVALVAFRGPGAQLLLPPTRSLVRAKRSLGALPGGGGTPLAAGLREGLDVALRARRQGLTPALVLLTDGKANLSLDGAADRLRAAEDAHCIARQVAAERIPGLCIDISPRPSPDLAPLVRSLGALHVPLPRADAGTISRAVAAALDG